MPVDRFTPRFGPWPWAIWRRFRRDVRDLAVRHARERAALTAWGIEVHHALAEWEITDAR